MKSLSLDRLYVMCQRTRHSIDSGLRWLETISLPERSITAVDLQQILVAMDALIATTRSTAASTDEARTR